MTKTELECTLAKCTVEALEQMFFVYPVESVLPSSPEADSDVICSVDFAGEPSGRLILRIAVVAARSIAAGFLGEDECGLSEIQVGDVLCELTNIICGSILSRIESKATFHLDSPRLLTSDSQLSADAIVHSVCLDNGVLTVRFATERTKWPIGV